MNSEKLEPSKECLNKIAKLQKYVLIKQDALNEAIQLAHTSQQEVKVAVERQKAAESTLSQAIQHYNNSDTESGKSEDFSYKLKN